ncbi:hypothetical protein DFH06DRAFT_1152715 [Mycena polygramma]|nr:hypothetical protein DFH06DRAFT_1152715 [Mycena polygramma]
MTGFGSAAIPLLTTTFDGIAMDQFQFTFNFTLPVYSPPPSPTPASKSKSRVTSMPSLPASTEAALESANMRASHCKRYPEVEQSNARDGAREPRSKGKKMRIPQELVSKKEVTPEKQSPAELLAMSSGQLRASRTFAAFREYVREFMFWVVVDDTDARAVAAWERFIQNTNPSPSNELADDDLEFLFRHVTPQPQGIDFESDTQAAVLSLDFGPTMMSSPNHGASSDQNEHPADLGAKRLHARQRMAQRRAAIKMMPPHLQEELRERARASRTKYREQKSVLDASRNPPTLQTNTCGNGAFAKADPVIETTNGSHLRTQDGPAALPAPLPLPRFVT